MGTRPLSSEERQMIRNAERNDLTYPCAPDEQSMTWSATAAREAVAGGSGCGGAYVEVRTDVAETLAWCAERYGAVGTFAPRLLDELEQVERERDEAQAGLVAAQTTIDEVSAMLGSIMGNLETATEKARAEAGL